MNKLSYIKSYDIKRIDVYQSKVHIPYTCDEVQEKRNIFGRVKTHYSPKAYTIHNEKYSTLENYVIAYNKKMYGGSLIYKEGQVFTKPYVTILTVVDYNETFEFDSFDEAKIFTERLANLANLICLYDTN